jgi:hypothetical protein
MEWEEVSRWRDEDSEHRGGDPTQTFERLEAVNEWGVVIEEEHSQVPEGVLAFYPWRSVVVTRVSEPGTRLAPLSAQRWVA